MELFSTDIRHPYAPLPVNPVRDMLQVIEHITDLPDISKYTPVVSKCGLGKTQGTKGTARGMQFDSYWEFGFYIYEAEIQGHSVVRNTKDSFDYTNSEGKPAKFYPDFKVDGRFYEIKGRFRPDDLLKREQTQGLVTFLDGAAMKPILKEVYKFRPNWKDEYLETTSMRTKYGR